MRRVLVVFSLEVDDDATTEEVDTLVATATLAFDEPTGWDGERARIETANVQNQWITLEASS